MILTDPTARLVIAHRGDSAHAPENTLEAFHRGATAGAHALELDVRLSADGVAVVIHDATLDRTTNATGPVSARTYSQLRDVDAGWHFTPDGGRSYPFRERGVRVSTLADVLTAFPQIPLVIEIKEARAQPAVMRIANDLGIARRCVFGSFDGAALVGFPRPPFAIGGAERELRRLYARSVIGWVPRSVGFDAIFATRRHNGIPIPVGPFVRAARALRIPLHLWVENDPADALRLWRAGVSGIITDDPERILAATRAPRRRS